jgi:hypothetical protein
MANALVVLCVLSTLFATGLIVAFAAGQTLFSLLKIVACVLLIDQSMITILFFLAKRLAKPLRTPVMVGAIGIMIGGVLLLVQNTAQKEAEPQMIITIIAVVAILQGALTVWQIARASASEPLP